VPVRQAPAIVLVCAAVVAALASAAPASRATFPGKNGPIAFNLGGFIYTENVDGTNRKRIVPLTLGVAVAATEPAWSPDGTKIAYSSKEGGTGGIFIVNADGTGTTRVTSDPADGEPAWSPDGKKLAFIHVSTGRRRLVTANLDGSNLFVVDPNLQSDADDPEWSPDGTRIAFSNFADIYVVNVDGSGLTDLTADVAEPSRSDNPSWSPDGSKIAYAYAGSIRVVAPNASGGTPIVSNLGEVWEISYSPDGSKIAIVADANGPLQEELFVVNADGTNLTRPNVDVDTTIDWGVAAAAPAVPPLVTGVNVNVMPVSGTPLVRLKGTTSFVPITALSNVPVGSELDLTKGRISMTSTAAAGKTQTAVFYQGRAIVGQTKAATPVTTLTLSGPLACPKRKSSAAAPPKTRGLWGNGKGNYTTNGKYAAATVRGTNWLTQDSCTGTLVKVVTGTVTVQDRGRHKTVTVLAGKSYFARARR
jgi:hypothetical protein